MAAPRLPTESPFVPASRPSSPITNALLRIVRTLAFAGVAACGPSNEPQLGPRPAHRLLVVGWDGATFDMVDPMLAAGRLPNLAALVARGRSARLASTTVPISSAAWVGAVTGKGPGETGVYSFFEPKGDGTYDVRVISSESNRAAPLWRILTGHGIGVNVIGVPVTFPPEPVLGTLVSGMLSPLAGGFAWPPSTARMLSERGFVPDLGIWRENQELSWPRVSEQLALKEQFVLERLRERDWSFSMVVFKNLDVVSHRAYDGRLDTDVARLMEALDATLGKMVAEVGSDTNVVLLSDHGFAAYPRAFNLHAWLVQEGLSVPRRGTDVGGTDGGPLAEARALEYARRLATLDLPSTRAFATTCEGNYGSIRLNRRGREPEGPVGEAEAEELIEALRARLLEASADDGGRPCVVDVVRGAELYPGPYVDIVPDLIVETRPDVLVVANTHAPVHARHERRFPDHARLGILVLAGPSIAPADERSDASIFDLAPTALHLLGQPVYREMRGRVLDEMLDVGQAPRLLDEADDPALEALRSRGSSPYSPEELEELTERLRSLGYTE